MSRVKPNILEVVESWKGFKPVRGRVVEGYGQKVAAVIDLIENTRGDSTMMWQARLEEAMGTEDFPTLFGDILQREMLANYQSTPDVMSRILRQKPINDFRTVRRSAGEGDYTARLQKIKTGGEYKARKKKARHFTYSLEKYGAIIPLFWEAWLNDADGFFKDLAEGLATASMNTRNYLLTSLFWDANGPIDAYFNHTSIGQKGVAATVLSNASLAAAIIAMTGGSVGYRDLNSEPILNIPKYLVVPPALQITALEVLRNAAMIATGVGSSAATKTSANVLTDFNIEVIVNPWIPVIVTSGTKGATTWGLFSSTISPGEVGTLRGRNEPEIFLKTSNSVSVAGGADASPFGGEFEDDSIQYKVRLVQGQVRLDQRGGWASDGQ